MENKELRMVYSIMHNFDDENGNPTAYECRLKGKTVCFIREERNGVCHVIDACSMTLLKTFKALPIAMCWVEHKAEEIIR